VTAGDGAATLSAVAELVINLSIAQRSHLIYGSGHMVARGSAAKAAATLAQTLELQAPISIHFTSQAVFCGSHCLERSHPIYRTYAQRLWQLGIAAVTFQAGATEADLVSLIEVLARASREHVTRERVEQMVGEAGLQRIEVQFLRQLVTHAERDEVEPPQAGEAAQLWEQVVADLAALSVPLGGLRDAPELDAAPERTGEGSPDYAGAVIDYLKQMQRTQQQDAVLQETDFGQQIGGLLASINPEMRRQLMTAAVAAPDMTPEMLHKLVNVVGYDHLLGALRRLNESGGGIPATAFRTLSMMAMLRGGQGPPPALGAGAQAAERSRSEEEMQGLLDQLLGEDLASRYTSEEYEKTLRDVEHRAQQVVRLRAPSHHPLPMSTAEGERHFLLVARQLLAESAGELEVASSVCRESQRSWARFAETAAAAPSAQAMQLAREAQAATGEPRAEPWVWESPEMLERLRQQLVEGTRSESEAIGELMVQVGAPAVPVLVDVLATSLSLSVRRRALAALEAIADSPASTLVPLLSPEQPWYLQRNAAYVLRRRRDPAGAAAAKALWRQAEPRVRLEILGYLLAIGDAERLKLLEEALADRDSEVAAAAARNAVKEPSDDVVSVVLRRAEQVPNDQVGMPFHLALLRALAASRMPLAVRYVAELPKRRRPLLPWQRERFRQQVAALVAEET
jgi:hypothetical protein